MSSRLFVYGECVLPITILMIINYTGHYLLMTIGIECTSSDYL